MIEASSFLRRATALGLRTASGVPCSYLKPLINAYIDDDALGWVGAANEGEAVAVGCGAWLGGELAITMFQNSGLGNAVNPLTSLCHTLQIPVLVITTLRGEPGGVHDEPQHELMGGITASMLDLMQVDNERFPEDERALSSTLERALERLHQRKTTALVMRKDAVGPHKLKRAPIIHALSSSSLPPSSAPSSPATRPSRRAVLEALQASAGDNDVIIATTGYTARELYALGDRDNQLYVVGSMGCASSVGLGLALAKADARVIVVDGDGAALMRLGALATLGYHRPDNLVHVLLDNEEHESTGGQSTVSHSVDLAAVAHACGTPRVVRASSVDDVVAALRGPRVHTFVHVKTAPGVPENLPRPRVPPHEVALRLRAHVAGMSSSSSSSSSLAAGSSR